MNHKFNRKEIRAGENWVEEKCACGQVSHRYRAGVRSYQQPDGKFTSTRAACTLEKPQPEERVKRANTRKVIPITEITPPPPLPDAVNFLATYEIKHQERLAARDAFDKKQIGFAETEAQLKDAYVIINLMYEELVTAGIHSAGRGMAGRLLYSVGYQEKVKKLERQ